MILNPHAMPAPRSERDAAFHRDQVRHHERLICVCRDLGNEEAAELHGVAAARHFTASGRPNDPKARRAAMQAGSIAEQASQRAGVKP
jgi:hypothetical protein